MALYTHSSLGELYEADETAWLDAMAELIQAGRLSELDFDNLKEYLADMSRSERRAVFSRLSLLIGHLLKWEAQGDRRSNSWRATILVQQQALRKLLESGALRRYAEESLPDAFVDGRELAKAESGLFDESFPAVCPYSIDQMLEFDLADEQRD